MKKPLELKVARLDLQKEFVDEHEMSLDSLADLSGWLDAVRLRRSAGETWLFAGSRDWTELYIAIVVLDPEDDVNVTAIGGVSRLAKSMAENSRHFMTGPIGCVGFVEESTRLVSVDEATTYERTALVTCDEALLGVHTEPHFGYRWTHQQPGSTSPEVAFLQNLLASNA